MLVLEARDRVGGRTYSICVSIEIYLAPSLSEVSHIIDSIYHNKLILSLSVSCKQLAGLNVVSNSFGVVIFWGIKLGDSKI